MGNNVCCERIHQQNVEAKFFREADENGMPQLDQPLSLQPNSPKDPYRIPILPDNVFKGGNTLKVPSQFASVTNAVAASNRGDIILVEPGIYKEAIVIRHSLKIVMNIVQNNNAPPEGAATLQSVTPQTTITVVGNRTLLYLENVIVKAPRDLGRGAMDHGLEVDSATVFLNNCEILGGHWGALVAGCGRVIAVSTKIKNARDHGMFIKDIACVWLDNCELANHGQSGLNVHDAGSHCVVVNSTIHSCKANGVFSYGGSMLRMRGNSVTKNCHAGICVCDLGSNAKIEDNKVNENGLQGVYVWDGGAAQISNNDLSGNGHWSLNIAPESKNLVVCQNNID